MSTAHLLKYRLTSVVPILFFSGFFGNLWHYPLTLQLPGVNLGTPHLFCYRTCDAVLALGPPAKHNLWQP